MGRAHGRFCGLYRPCHNPILPHKSVQARGILGGPFFRPFVTILALTPFLGDFDHFCLGSARYPTLYGTWGANIRPKAVKMGPVWTNKGLVKGL